jgi:hypothetical protein
MKQPSTSISGLIFFPPLYQLPTYLSCIVYILKLYCQDKVSKEFRNL